MKRGLAVAGLLVALGLGAAPKFEKVPDAARTALSGVRGKPVDTGLVFANGHFIKPSYRVARYGTAIFVNDTQISGQIVPWRAFLDAQDGAAPRPAARPAPAPAPAAKPPAAKTVDDLFDDEAPPASDANAASAGASSAVEDDGGDGSFAPNGQTKKLLERINARRTSINRRLLAGDVCFFGSRYAPVYVAPRIGRGLLKILPEAIRDADGAADLHALMRQKGYAFMTRELCEDLVANRADYPALLRHRQRLEEDEKFKSMVNGANPEYAQ
ncbi:MAG: hypothetical protein ACI4Q3_10130 [Kiritimatiellia bacterium]